MRESAGAGRLAVNQPKAFQQRPLFVDPGRQLPESSRLHHFADLVASGLNSRANWPRPATPPAGTSSRSAALGTATRQIATGASTRFASKRWSNSGPRDQSGLRQLALSQMVTAAVFREHMRPGRSAAFPAFARNRAKALRYLKRGCFDGCQHAARPSSMAQLRMSGGYNRSRPAGGRSRSACITIPITSRSPAADSKSRIAGAHLHGSRSSLEQIRARLRRRHRGRP